MKRGISPLIATVLIIGFTIALAAIVMTWGGGFIKSSTKETGETALKEIESLQDVDVKITKASVFGGMLGLNVVNNGKQDIAGFIVKVSGTDGGGSGRIDEGVPGYGGGSFLVDIDNMPSNVEKVELFPIIDYEGEQGVSKSGFVKKKTSPGFSHDDLFYMNFDSSSTNLITGMVVDIPDTGEIVESVKDLSGKGNDGTAGGEVLLVDGLMGKAIEIHNSGTHNPSDSFNHVSTSSIVVPSGSSFSVSALINADSWPDNYNNVVNEYVYISSSNQRGFILGRYGSRMFYVLGGEVDGANVNCKIDASSPSAGEWHHIVGTFKRGEIKYYVDGVETGTQSGTCDFDYKASTKPLRIGARAGENRWGFNGKIDEVVVVDRVLTAEEISGMYDLLI